LRFIEIALPDPATNPKVKWFFRATPKGKVYFNIDKDTTWW